MSRKVTPWFSGQQKPYRSGTYEFRCGVWEPTPIFRTFMRNNWAVKGGWRDAGRLRGICPRCEWRGLEENPNVK